MSNKGDELDGSEFERESTSSEKEKPLYRIRKEDLIAIGIVGSGSNGGDGVPVYLSRPSSFYNEHSCPGTLIQLQPMGKLKGMHRRDLLVFQRIPGKSFTGTFDFHYCLNASHHGVACRINLS